VVLSLSDCFETSQLFGMGGFHILHRSSRSLLFALVEDRLMASDHLFSGERN
jgi:hypothetical protein